MRLAALEKNILVYRALQMALFLFYAEDIRKQLVLSVGLEVRKGKGAQLKGGKLLKAIFLRLVGEKLISDPESAELQELIEHRNQIAHHIHLLTGDIEVPGRRYGFGRALKLRYDYEALTRVEKWQDELWRRVNKKYWLAVTSDSLLFEAAEHAYHRELSSLKRRIHHQIEGRKKSLARRGPNPQGGANGRQPFGPETNRASAAAASRRSP
jgi:hypothetical protein